MLSRVETQRLPELGFTRFPHSLKLWDELILFICNNFVRHIL
ncbi:hypothetical protein GXM_01927 [Nostoc sphaeroides CCNUC1]|uniref:Uncharacterized protein n=1 Tax=Nostoc sphaeroides CCNUC1 TaxID=2653204 RepID=A0A5P8VVK6_9NOSO|nr:hypothetical protein GXM_01927 [Nostoc sphaeroides CCNUC1]